MKTSNTTGHGLRSHQCCLLMIVWIFSIFSSHVNARSIIRRSPDGPATLSEVTDIASVLRPSRLRETPANTAVRPHADSEYKTEKATQEPHNRDVDQESNLLGDHPLPTTFASSPPSPSHPPEVINRQELPLKLIQHWASNWKTLESQGLSGNVLLQACDFLDFAEVSPFWHENALEELEAFQEELQRIPHAWQKIIQNLAPVVPVQELSRGKERWEFQSLRLKEDPSTFWWMKSKGGMWSRNLDRIDDMKTLIDLGDALRLDLDIFDPMDRDHALKLALDAYENYFWKRTGEASVLHDIKYVDPLDFEYRRVIRNTKLDENIFKGEKFGAEQLDGEMDVEFGEELVRPRLESLLGDAAQRTQPIRGRTSIKDGETWSDRRLQLEWYLAGFNPYVMDDFGKFLQQAAEHDAEAQRVSSQIDYHGKVTQSIPSWRELKAKPENLAKAAAALSAHMQQSISDETLSPIKTWYQHALTMTVIGEVDESPFLAATSHANL